MTPTPNGPLILTELVKDVQQLPGHDAASSTKVHGPKETGLILLPEPFNIFNPNPPTTSPIHCHPPPPATSPATAAHHSQETSCPPSWNGPYLG